MLLGQDHGTEESEEPNYKVTEETMMCTEEAIVSIHDTHPSPLLSTLIEGVY
jgi:hypothetical protein